MATKTISITEEAYRKLASMKKENESFSKVIERIAGKKKLGKFFGVLSEETANKLEKAIKDGRKEHRRLSAVRMKRLWEDE